MGRGRPHRHANVRYSLRPFLQFIDEGRTKEAGPATWRQRLIARLGRFNRIDNSDYSAQTKKRAWQMGERQI